MTIRSYCYEESPTTWIPCIALEANRSTSSWNCESNAFVMIHDSYYIAINRSSYKPIKLGFFFRLMIDFVQFQMTSRKSHVNILITSMYPHIHIFQIKLPSFTQFTTVVFFGTTKSGRTITGTTTAATAATATAAATAAVVVIGGVGVGEITISTDALSFWTWSCDPS